MALFWKTYEDLLVQDSMYFDLLVLRLSGTYGKMVSHLSFFCLFVLFLAHLGPKHHSDVS